MKQSEYLSKMSVDDNMRPQPAVSLEEKIARKDIIDSIRREAKIKKRV